MRNQLAAKFGQMYGNDFPRVRCAEGDVLLLRALVEKHRHEERFAGEQPLPRSHKCTDETTLLLRAVTENRHGLALQQLVHENPHDVAIPVSDVLPFAIHIVGAEDDVLEAEHLIADQQFSFHRQLGDPVGVFRERDHVLSHGRLAGSIDGNRGGEHEALDAVIDARIDEVHGTDQVVGVIEPFDEMAESFGGIGSQVVHIGKGVLLKQTINERMIKD